MTNLDIIGGNLIDSLPYICFKRDPDSRFSYVSKPILNWGLFNSLDEIIGKSDFDMPWHTKADQYIEEDQLALKGKSQFLLHSLPRLDGSALLHFCHKTPLYNDKRKVIGVGGVGFELTFENYKNIYSTLGLAGLHFSNFMTQDQSKQTEYIYKNISFTKRQAQIISFWLQGYSAKVTANKLNLTKRTIEFYLTRIKEKLECKNKQELIKKSFELGFIDLMFIKF